MTTTPQPTTTTTTKKTLPTKKTGIEMGRESSKRKVIKAKKIVKSTFINENSANDSSTRPAERKTSD